MGDGSSQGTCPDNPSDMKCFSTGECNICTIISGNHEGCDITSSTPVCDADSTVSGFQDSAVCKVAECAACKKSGRCTVIL